MLPEELQRKTAPRRPAKTRNPLCDNSPLDERRDMSEQIQLSSELRFDEFVTSETTAIVDSHAFRGGDWRKLTQQTSFADPVGKFIIPVNISGVRFLVLTEVKASASVASHEHAEAILRFVVSGEFELNGVTYGPGDWVYVPAGVACNIRSESGYTTLAGYGLPCDG
jgi:hypothetical protein